MISPLKNGFSKLKELTLKGYNKTKKYSLDTFDNYRFKAKSAGSYVNNKIDSTFDYAPQSIKFNTDESGSGELKILAGVGLAGIGTSMMLYNYFNDIYDNPWFWRVGGFLLTAAGITSLVFGVKRDVEELDEIKWNRSEAQLERKRVKQAEEDRREKQYKIERQEEREIEDRERQERKQIENERFERLKNYIPNVTPDLSYRYLEKDSHGKLTITATNSGTGKAYRLNVNLRAPIKTKQTRFRYDELDIGRRINETIDIVPTERGEMEWKIITEYYDELNRHYEKETKKWVKVAHEPLGEIRSIHQHAGRDIVDRGSSVINTEVHDSALVRSNVGTGNQKFEY